MRKFLSVLLIVLSAVFLSREALAAQIVDINNGVSHDVFGNGSLPDGKGPYDGGTLKDSNSNTVNVNRHGVSGDVYGAYNSDVNATVTKNTVNINDEGDVNGSIYGGGGENDVIGNTINIIGGKVVQSSNFFRSSYIVGGMVGDDRALVEDLEEGDAKDNTVNISNGDKSESSVSADYIYGGFSDYKNSSGNAVNINGGIVNVDRYIYAGIAETDSTNNILTISGGSVTAGTIGGGISTSSEGGDSTYNTVNISGGTMDIYTICGGDSDEGNATYNTVTINGNPTFTRAPVIHGGRSDGDAVSGNTLNLHIPLRAKEVENFQTFRFFLPANIKSGERMLEVEEKVDLRCAVSVDIGQTHASLNVNDTVRLITNVIGTFPTTIVKTGGHTSNRYTFEVSLQKDESMLPMVSMLVAKVMAVESVKPIGEFPENAKAIVAETFSKVSDVAANISGFNTVDFELNESGEVTVVQNIAEQAASDALNDSSKEIKDILPLPVISGDIERNSEGNVAAIGLIVKGSELMVEVPSEINLVKILSPTTGAKFNWESDPGKFGDEKFTLQSITDGSIIKKIDKDTSYRLVIFIKDAGRFDLDGVSTPNGVVLDPLALFSTKDKSSSGGDSGGCNFGVGMLGALLVPFMFRRRK